MLRRHELVIEDLRCSIIPPFRSVFAKERRQNSVLAKSMNAKPGMKYSTKVAERKEDDRKI